MRVSKAKNSFLSMMLLVMCFIRSNRNPKTINNCGKRRECVWIVGVEGSSQGLEDAPRSAGMWREDKVQGVERKERVWGP